MAALKTVLPKCEYYFIVCLLPEVLGHWYTCPLVSSMNEGQPSQSVADVCNEITDEEGQSSSFQLMAAPCDKKGQKRNFI